MTTEDIKNVIYKYLKQTISVPITKDIHPDQSVINERIVINVIGINAGSWESGKANINWFVPDINPFGYYEPDSKRLNYAEGILKGLFNHGKLLKSTTEFIHMENESVEIISENNSHYINYKIKLKIDNH